VKKKYGVYLQIYNGLEAGKPGGLKAHGIEGFDLPAL
jgi:hypothetical protein